MNERVGIILLYFLLFGGSVWIVSLALRPAVRWKVRRVTFCFMGLLVSMAISVIAIWSWMPEGSGLLRGALLLGALFFWVAIFVELMGDLVDRKNKNGESE